MNNHSVKNGVNIDERGYYEKGLFLFKTGVFTSLVLTSKWINSPYDKYTHIHIYLYIITIVYLYSIALSG